MWTNGGDRHWTKAQLVAETPKFNASPYNLPWMPRGEVEVQFYSFFNLGARWGVGGQGHAPAAFLPRKTRYPLYRTLGGPQGRSGRVRNISPPPGFEPRTVQHVASRYTDWDIPAPRLDNFNSNYVNEACCSLQYLKLPSLTRVVLSTMRPVCPLTTLGTLLARPALMLRKKLRNKLKLL